MRDLVLTEVEEVNGGVVDDCIPDIGFPDVGDIYDDIFNSVS